MFKQGRYCERISGTSGAFLASVLEYLVAEILESAGNLCQENKKRIIQPRHINLAFRHDEELSKMITHTTITQGGMVQHINDKLLPKKGGKSMVEPSQAV
jgi:histone H2A